jgi:hypothetical protein
MDANAAKPVRQKKASKLQKRDKEKCVATVDANHPALAVLRSMRRLNPVITSGTPCRTSPRRPEAASRDNTALLTLNAGNDNMLLLTPHILLSIPPVIDVDVPNRENINVDSNIDSDNELSSVSSDARSMGEGKLILGKGTTVVDVVEGEYAHLPNDYSLTYSATGNKLRGGDNGHDNDDLNGLNDVSVTDETTSKYNSLIVWPNIWTYTILPIAFARLLSLQFFAGAGTFIRGLDPMKRAKQEEIFMRKYIHIVTNIDGNQFKHK